uniref:Uncharacterized protein n=1 Tax=Cacopsylla melanoneura TaxID=428564 RepID=A0A8D9BEI1_9HEMI
MSSDASGMAGSVSCSSSGSWSTPANSFSHFFRSSSLRRLAFSSLFLSTSLTRSSDSVSIFSASSLSSISPVTDSSPLSALVVPSMLSSCSVLNSFSSSSSSLFFFLSRCLEDERRSHIHTLEVCVSLGCELKFVYNLCL